MKKLPLSWNWKKRATDWQLEELLETPHMVPTLAFPAREVSYSESNPQTRINDTALLLKAQEMGLPVIFRADNVMYNPATFSYFQQFSTNPLDYREHGWVVEKKTLSAEDLTGYFPDGLDAADLPIQIPGRNHYVTELHEQEQVEIEHILIRLTDAVRQGIDRIESDIESVVMLDLLFAKAQYAGATHANRPIFNERLNIVNGFHPILRSVNESVVPLNLKLNSGKRVLLISGPNAGGKTVVLKTVGLIALMAKCGLFVPADEGSSVPFFDEFYADIGDEQSIESQLSTFAGHLKQIKSALEAEGNVLVLLDELMSQTSVEEGSALAAAVLDDLRKKGIVLATTHNENLKIYVSDQSDMINAGMEYTDQPTYRLILGVPQPSNAIKLAKQLGLRKRVLERANSYLDAEKVSVNKLFEDLSKELKAVDEERKQLSRLVTDYEEKLAAFNVKKKQQSEELRTKYRNELTKAKRDVEKLIKALRKEGPRPDTVHKTRRYFADKLDHAVQADPYHPDQGELVRIRELRKIGQVVAEKQGKYKISLENIFYWVEPTDIEPIRAGEEVQK